MKKNSIKIYCLTILAAFSAVGCATIGPLEVTNKSHDLKPEWAGGEKKFNRWKKEQEEEDKKAKRKIHYFYGESNYSPQQISDDAKKSSKYVWSFDEAYSEAIIKARKDLSNFIESNIEIKESIREKGTQHEVQESFESDIKAWSFSIVRNLKTERYIEVHTRKIGDQTVSSTHCYLYYPVTEDQVNEARKLAGEGKLRQQIEEEKILKKLEKDFNRVSRELARMTGANKSDNRLYDIEFTRLLEIDSKLGDLHITKTRTDSVGENYKKFAANVKEAKEKYDPVERSRDDIMYLKKRSDEQSREIENLKLQVSANRRPHVLSPPFRPAETKIESVNIFVANDMVSNFEFMSFESSRGRHSYFRINQGLNSPTVSVSWNDAALYCNWLSRLYKYKPCYTVVKGKVTGYDKTQNGFRLPEYGEIVAMYEAKTGVIDEEEFAKIGIWSSGGTPTTRNVYKLSNGSQLASQSFNGTVSNKKTGFRIVRNAK